MNRFRSLLLVLLSTVLIVSCESRRNGAENLASDDTQGVEVTNTAVIVVQQVADFEYWLTEFDKGDSLRRARGLLTDSVYRDLEDSSMVLTASYTRDHSTAKSYMQSEESRKFMDESGVLSEPIVSYWDIQWRSESDSLPEFFGYVMLSHGVESYDVWERYFLNGDAHRRGYGIYALMSALDVDSVNNVGVLLGITDFEKANKILEEEDLVADMVASGVLGRPIVQVISAVP